MVIKTPTELKADMQIGVAKNVSVQKIHNVIDSFDDRCKSLEAPNIISGTINAANWPGVVAGTLDAAGRIANATALQSAFDSAGTNGKYIEMPSGTYQYTATATHNGRNVGLRLPHTARGMIGEFHSDKRTQLIQYAADHPALTLGSAFPADYAIGSQYQGITVSHGVQGTANSRGFLVGSMFQCRLDDMKQYKWGAGSIFHPYIGWEHVPGAEAFFFSNQIGTLLVGGGQQNLFRFTVNGTGSTWDNIYLGGGSNSERTTLSGDAVYIANTHQSSFRQLNIEWVNTSCLLNVENTQALAFDSVHCEGNNLTGFAPRYAHNAYSQLNFRAIQFFDCAFMTSNGLSGTPSFFTAWGESQTIVDTVEARWKSAGNGWGESSVRFRVFTPATSADNNTVKQQFQIRQMKFNNHSAGSDLDTTVTGSTFGEVQRAGDYRFNRLRSETFDATIKAPTGNGNFTAYGAHQNSLILVDSPITTDRNIILSDKRAPSGIGSTVNCVAGDIREVARTGNATGAFNILVRDQTNTSTLATLSATNSTVRLMFDGTNWILG